MSQCHYFELAMLNLTHFIVLQLAQSQILMKWLANFQCVCLWRCWWHSGLPTSTPKVRIENDLYAAEQIACNEHVEINFFNCIPECNAAEFTLVHTCTCEHKFMTQFYDAYAVQLVTFQYLSHRHPKERSPVSKSPPKSIPTAKQILIVEKLSVSHISQIVLGVLCMFKYVHVLCGSMHDLPIFLSTKVQPKNTERTTVFVYACLCCDCIYGSAT